METAAATAVAATTTAAAATETIKKGWWASRSNITKGLIITGAIVVIVGGAYLLLRKPDEEESKKSNANGEGGESDSDESQSTDNNTNDEGSKSETVNESTEHKAEQSSDNSNEKQQGIVYDASTLPNSGEGCSEPKLNYDGNYDYVKCNGVWYVKSKQNPKTPSTNIPNWAGLKSDSVRASRLNSRYPNG